MRRFEARLAPGAEQAVRRSGFIVPPTRSAMLNLGATAGLRLRDCDCGTATAGLRLRDCDWGKFQRRAMETTGRLDRGEGIELAWSRLDGAGPTVVFLPGFARDMDGEK